MKEYEVVCTYLNGCAGEAYPQRSFEEIEAVSTDAYIQAKHGREAARFVKEVLPGGQILHTFDNGTVKYIYEFTEL